MAAQIEAIAMIMNVIEEDEAEFEGVLMALARVAAAEIMEMEEGVGLDDLLGETWVPVTVIINEYHYMGDPCFRLHFRMRREIFEALSATVRDHLVDAGRLTRERRPFQDIVLMVLWLMATPDTFRSVALRFGVRPSTLHYFYTYVIEALRELSTRFIVWPTAEERNEIKNVFQEVSGFPGIVGCIDGTHINITTPVVDGAQYVNRHHTCSINTQAVVDNNLLVRHLHVGEVGSMNDGRVFKRSTLYTDLLTSEPGELVDHDEHLVGDGAYTLTNFMMIPHPNNGHLNVREVDFNRSLSQCRVRVENSFARAKGMWRRLKFLHVRNRQNLVDHVTASFVIHNFIILHGEPMIDEDELRRPIHGNQILGNEAVEAEDEHMPIVHAELQAVAEATGIEKRLFIMNEVLPNV